MENGAQANVVALPHGNPPLSKCNSQSPSESYDDVCGLAHVKWAYKCTIRLSHRLE